MIDTSDILFLLGCFIADPRAFRVLAQTTADFLNWTSPRTRRGVAAGYVRGALTFRLDGDHEGAAAFRFCAGLLLWANKEASRGE